MGRGRGLRGRPRGRRADARAVRRRGAGAHDRRLSRGLGPGRLLRRQPAGQRGFVAVALWLRDLILLPGERDGAGPVPRWSSRSDSPLQALSTALAGARGAGRRSGSGSPSGSTHERHSIPTAVRERADVAQLVLVARLPGPGRRVLPDPGHPAREVPAPRRDQPPPADSAHAAPRHHPRPEGRRHRGERAGLHGQAARAVGGLAPGRARPRSAVRAARQRAGGPRSSGASRRPATSRRSCSATPVVRDHRTAGGAPRRAARGCVIQSEPQAALPGGQGGRAPGGIRRRGHRSTTSTAKRFPGAGLGTIVGKAGLERQYDDTLRGSEGVRYIEVNARGRLVREDAGSPSLGADAGTAAPHHDRPRRSSATSTASGLVRHARRA